MTLRDWRVRDLRISMLEEAINNYREYISQTLEDVATLEELEARWAMEVDHIERIHEAVHKLRKTLHMDIYLTCEEAKIPPKEMPKLPKIQLDDLLLDMQAIRTSLWPSLDKTSVEKRQERALEVVYDFINYVNNELESHRSRISDLSEQEEKEIEERWALHLVALVGQFHNKSIVDTGEMRHVAGGIWKSLDGRLRRELMEMEPPMTWAEILLHYLKYLEDFREEDPALEVQRQQIGKYLNPQQYFYCLECDNPFVLDKRHPGRFICPRCRARKRKQKQREQQQKKQAGSQ